VTGPFTSPLRCAVVGVGWAGARLLEAVDELDGDIEVACLVDPDEERLAEVARRFGVERVHTRMHDALSDDVEAVIVCSPHRHHAEQSLDAIQAGRHVLVEKPMALDLRDADAMVEAAARASVVLGVAENEVHEEWVAELRREVESGARIGEVAFGVVIAGGRMPDLRYPGRRAWLTEPGAGGTGSWMLHGIHTVAVARHVFGDFRRVHAVEHRTGSFERPDLEATMSLHLTTESGVPVHLVQTPEVDLGVDRRAITIYGDRGIIRADPDGWMQMGAQGERAAMKAMKADGRARSYARELRAFVGAVRDGVTMSTSGASERHSLAVVLAALESVRAGRAVEIS
jgi:predicted dehydrogenase